MVFAVGDVGAQVSTVAVSVYAGIAIIEGLVIAAMYGAVRWKDRQVQIARTDTQNAKLLAAHYYDQLQLEGKTDDEITKQALLAGVLVPGSPGRPRLGG